MDPETTEGVSPETTAPAGAPEGESDDDIIASIKAEIQTGKDKAAVDSKPVADVESDEDEDDGDEDAPTDEDEEPDEEESQPDAKPLRGDKAKAKKLDDALAALEDGDLEKALSLAFGKSAKDFSIDPGKWTAFRAAQRREQTALKAAQAKHQQREQAFKAEVQATVQELQPAATFIRVQRDFAQTGDWGLIVKLAEGITGKSWDEVNKHCLRQVKRSPEAMRIQAELDALKAQLAQREQQQTEQQQRLTVEQQYTADLHVIREQTTTHKVRHIPGFERRVYNVLLKTRDPNIGLTMTVKEAASRVFRGEKKRLEKLSGIFGAKKAEAEPKPSVKKTTGNKPILRRDSTTDAGTRPEDESTEDIISDLQRQISRQRLGSKSNGKVRRAS
jgi:hypothetical protein